jgi:hypothetical protein
MPPVKHLLAIAEKNNETLTKMALDDWYMSAKKTTQLLPINTP